MSDRRQGLTDDDFANLARHRDGSCSKGSSMRSATNTAGTAAKWPFMQTAA